MILKSVLALFLLSLFGFYTNKYQTKHYSNGFDFPIGALPTVTEKKDKDAWYNAQDFKINTHLGEDWNLNSGGNTDCGQPVYASSTGYVTYAQDAGPGWGNVVIIRHLLPNNTEVETLYGHLSEVKVKSGQAVKRREPIGKVGDGAAPCGDSKPYYAHLHFEIRQPNCRHFGIPGGGYSPQQDYTGWLDPSTFINRFRKL
jgi:hypothetical protein